MLLWVQQLLDFPKYTKHIIVMEHYKYVLHQGRKNQEVLVVQVAQRLQVLQFHRQTQKVHEVL